MKQIKTLKAAAKNYALCIMNCALCLASCSTDDLEGDALGDRYPLQIASASVGDGQTRIAENADGSASVWQGGEEIGVKIGDGEAGTYTVNADGSVTAVNPCYWQSIDPQTVTAWYPADQSATVDLSDQSKGLVYVLKATAEDVSFGSSPTLTFKNQLAKVRVKVLDAVGNQITYTAISIKGATTCAIVDGIMTAGKTTDYIPMHLASDNYYEANVIPTTLNTSEALKITSNDKTAYASLANNIELNEGTTNNIVLNIKPIEKTLDSNITISDNGTYYITGSGSGTITIEGSPTIILDNVTSTLDKFTPPISITGENSNPTIILVGTNTFKKSDNYYYSQLISLSNGANVTIDGQGYGEMIVTAKYYLNDDALIGPAQNETAGDIVIKNATLDFSTDNNDYYFDAPIIGSGYAVEASSICGNITIENSTLNVSSYIISEQQPAIGAGKASSYYINAISQCGDINITNSTLNINLSSNSGDPFIGSSNANCNIDNESPSGMTAVSSCGNVTITLKEGDSKDAFLARLVGDSDYDGDKIDCGNAYIYNYLEIITYNATATSKIGTITWKESNGNVIETTEAKENIENGN